MENHKLVLPENLNHHGFLFGGYLLKWVDEYAWIAASLDYPTCRFVTVGMDDVAFRKSVRSGSVLRFDVARAKQGVTSVQYRVIVTRCALEGEAELKIFSTHVTFVNVDLEGRKQPLPSE